MAAWRHPIVSDVEACLVDLRGLLVFNLDLRMHTAYPTCID
jgi:hypothetical protein